MLFQFIFCCSDLNFDSRCAHVIICSSHLGVCTVWPRWPLWHWPESLKSLLHMSVKQEIHRLCVRHWDCERWNIKSRTTVWKVKMRLVVGFCQHFAKANFSSLSITKLEAIEVRGLVSVLDSWFLISVLLCLTVQEMFIFYECKRGSQASLSSTWILFCDDGWRSPSLSLTSHLLIISPHLFSSTIVFFFFILMLSKTRVCCKANSRVCWEKKGKKSWKLMSLLLCIAVFLRMQFWCLS